MTDLNGIKNVQEKKHHSIVLFFVLFFLIFLISIFLYLFAYSFSHFISENAFAKSFLSTLSNPIVAIFLGALVSLIIRSSSIVITILAAMVAAGFPFVEAIFILLGANIGTTFHGGWLKKIPDCDIYDKQRMTSISSMHYFNNVIAFCIFFPLQISTNFLGDISELVIGWVIPHNILINSVEFQLVNSWGLHPLTLIIQEYLAMNLYPLISLLVLFLAITLLMRIFFIVLRVLFDSFVIRMLDVQMGKEILEEKVLLIGIFVSSLLQSSSSTLYVLMPLVRKVSCSSRSFYPLILGINVGTCFTTILFSLLLQSKLGLAVGFAHLLYNLFSLIIFTYVPFLRELPILASRQLAFCSYDMNTPENKH